MRKTAAAAGSSLFFAVAPGVVAGVVPWSLTRWTFDTPTAGWLPFRWLGGALVAVSVAFLLHAFARFVIDGLGTPAPIAPTEHLVVTGAYRFVRNPMYLAVTGAIAGQALLFGRLGLLVYAALVLATTFLFVQVYEQPTLREQFGDQYERYCAAVPGWWPRMRPWRP